MALYFFKEEKYFQIVIDSLKYCVEKKALSLIGYVLCVLDGHGVMYIDKDILFS